MTTAQVQSKGISVGNGNTSVALTLTGVSAGNHIAAFSEGHHVGSSLTVGLTTATSPSGTFLNAIAPAEIASATATDRMALRIDYTENAISGSWTVTFHATNTSYITGEVSESSGVVTSRSLGVTNSQAVTTPANTGQPGSITPSAGSIVYTAMTENGSNVSTAAATIDSGFTVALAGGAGTVWDTNTCPGGQAYKANVASAAVNPTWTMQSGNQPDRSILGIVEFKATLTRQPILWPTSSRPGDLADGENLAASTTHYNPIGLLEWNSGYTVEADLQQTIRAPGTFSNLYIRIISNDRGASTWRLRKNGANGNSVCSIGASTTGEFQDTTNTDAVVSGDKMCTLLSVGAGGTIFNYGPMTYLFGATSNTYIIYGGGGGYALTPTASATFFNSFATQNVDSQDTVEAENQTKSRATGTLKNLFVYVSANACTSPLSFFDRKNGANGNQSISVAASATGAFEDTTNTTSVSGGDLVNLGWTTGSGVGNLYLAQFSVGWETASGTFPMVNGGGAGSIGAGLTRYAALSGRMFNASTESHAQCLFNFAATLSNLSSYLNQNTSAQTTTVRTRVNGANGTQTLSIGATATGLFEDVTNSESALPSDSWDYQVVNAAGSGATGFLTLWVNVAVVAAPQEARPATSVTNGSWLNEAGTNTSLYASLNETSPNDANYIQSSAYPQSDLVEYGLSAVTDPLVDTGHVLRYRVRVDQIVGGSVSLVTELRSAASAALGTPVSFTDTLASLVETTISQPLSAAQVQALRAVNGHAGANIRHTATQAIGAAPTFVAAGTFAATATNNASITPGLPAGTNGQDILLLVIQRGDNTAATAISGWTNIAALTSNDGLTQRVEVWWRVAAGSAGSATTTTAPAITFGSSTVVRSGQMYAFRGADTTTPFVLSSFHANASGNTCATTDISPTVANTLGFFVGTAVGQRTAATTPTNWNAPVVSNTALGNNASIMYTRRTYSSSGAYGAPSTTWTSTTTGVTEGILFAIQPSAGNSRARVTWAELEVPSPNKPPLVMALPPYQTLAVAGF